MELVGFTTGSGHVDSKLLRGGTRWAYCNEDSMITETRQTGAAEMSEGIGVIHPRQGACPSNSYSTWQYTTGHGKFQGEMAAIDEESSCHA
ncbi:hypothetical protein PENANT_c003G00756 [Penicillium antarcticum]|uniref:Uncharacterized protein n=1 Tax=Penicillium antarcticum TaxID=416450 RepID=A0A1V6QIE0_9EURO|nr:hypothetical protein PENANT_c003G00756 [Penicillium antarcticum]